MKKETIAVIGVGKLGLAFAIYLNHFRKFNVIGIDKNKKIINKSRNKKNQDHKIQNLLKKTSIKFSTDIKKSQFAKIIFIFVDTPSLSSGDYDHSKILKVISEIENFDKKIVVICSTVMPGFCDSVKTKHDLVYSPQFVSQGNVIENIKNPNFILVGSNKESVFVDIQKIFHKPIEKTKLIEAEIIKIALNCFVTMKITFANIIGDLCKFVSCDQNKVLKTISKDKRIGSESFSYGYGYGGPCFPRDNKAFSNFINKYFTYNLSKVVDETNRIHLENQIKLFKKEIFPDNVKKTNKGFIINNLGYNKSSNMIDNSQSLELALILAKEGQNITIQDSEKLINVIFQKYGNIFEYIIKK